MSLRDYLDASHANEKLNDKVVAIIPGHISTETNKYIDEQYIPLNDYFKDEAKFWKDFPQEKIGLPPKESLDINVIVPP